MANSHKNVSEYVLSSFSAGKSKSEILAELLNQGHEEHSVSLILDEAVKQKLANKRTVGCGLILTGAAICLGSCIYSLMATYSSLPMSLYGLTTLGILVVFAGLIKIFE